ncbi:MAG: asparagine synthase (glutamine-hydrolyzing) [Rhodothermales bacterium]
MCGIAGICNLNGDPVSVMVLKHMADRIAHRGPDGEGFFSDGAVGLAHRRLAIIDLSEAGRQPMTNETEEIFLVYNGEIYNFQELRKELEALGHSFRSRTDAEMVVHAYEEWGEVCVHRFNGMFAFALWDRPRKQLFLARDRYGIKPLYYAQQGQTFAFGSEVKTILAHPAFHAAVDKEALLEYFTFQNLFTDRTLFAGVCLLPAGCWMTRSLQDAADPAPVRYWDFQFEEPESPDDEQAYLEELDRLFSQAVKRQLVSDVEVGAYLSGGMDSGSITAVAAAKLPYLKTFTCGFDLRSASGLELGFDEREKAEYMSYLFKTEHYEMVLKAGDMERVMPKLSWHLEEPRVGQSYPNYYAAQLASKFVKVVLAGTGGDELFGGYPWRYYRAVVNDDFEDYIDKYYDYWQRLISNRAIQQVFQPIWSDVQNIWTRDLFRDVFDHHAPTLIRPEDYVNHSLYLESKTFLHGLLVVEDKLSMAHSLETRVPFLDNDLVDFAMRLPVRLKLGKLDEIIYINENDPRPKMEVYYRKTQDGKLLLRKMMQRYIPSEVTRGEKKGFSAPDASWFRGESLDYVRRKLIDGPALIYEYLDRRAVQRLVEEHLQGKQNRRLFIWSLLNVEWWLRTFLDSDQETPYAIITGQTSYAP